MKNICQAKRLGSVIALSIASISFSQSSQAIDPFTVAVLIGGVAAASSHHHHYSYHHTYPRYRTVTSPVYLSSYGYAPAYRSGRTQRVVTTSYIVRRGVRGHSCGYDGICLGN